MTQLLNQHLILCPKPVKEAPRKRPDIDLVHQEIRILQKIQQTEVMGIVDDDSVIQLGRQLKRDYYSVKNIIPGFKTKKGKQKFKDFEQAKTYFSKNRLTKRELCSLIHSFYDVGNNILAQTNLIRKEAWRMLFEQSNDLGWDSDIPITVQNMALMSLKAFFYELKDTNLVNTQR